MGIIVPPSVNYQSPLNAVPTFWWQQPREGPKMIVCEIDWGAMGGPNNCVNINLQNNATLEFSQIVCVSVDNSLCGADLEFVFPDTAETLSIPAYAPKCIVPVFTNMTQFYVWCPGARDTDTTRFSIHNLMPPPVSVPFTIEQQIISNSNIIGDGATDAIMIPAGVFGTLESIQVLRTGPITIAGAQQFSINDGNNTLNFGGTFAAKVDNYCNTIMLDLQGMHIRFDNGLTFNQSGDSMGGAWTVNGLYRLP